jgi:predicted RND superfamily exporter protein
MASGESEYQTMNWPTMNQLSRRRLAPLILVGTILCLPLIGYGVHRTVESNCNDVRQWLPSGIVETQEYDWFVEQFGSDEIVVVSWPGCNLDDSRIDLAAGALAQWTSSGTAPTAVDASADRPRYFKNVVTGRELLAELTAPPLRLKRSQAKARLSGTLIGKDGYSTGLLLQISEIGAANRHAAMDAVYETVESATNVSRSQIRIGGQTADSVALDIESQRSRLTLTGISAFAAVVLAWCCLRQMRLVVAVASTALLCAAISLSLVYFTGGKMCLLLVTMPTLIYVLAVSAVIHLTHYYLDAIKKYGVATAPARAIAAGWLPCTLTAATTAVGLGSLALSEIVPVRMFGIYSALGVLISLPILFLFLPSVWQIWPAQAVSKRKRTTDSRFAMRGWVSRFPRFVGQNHGWIVAGGILVTLVLGSGVARLDTSIKLLNLFSPEAQIIGDYQWLEKHLGGMVPVEVVVGFDPDNEVSILERMEVVSMVGRGLKQMDKVDGAISAATFAPSIPRPGGLLRTAKRGILRNELEKSADAYVRRGFVKPSPEGQLWRVSARVEALNALDYGHFIEQMRQRIDPLLAQYNERLGGGISATYTGMVPLVYKAQRMLLDDLIKSFLLAFLLIGVVMVAMLGSLRAGLISMIPNVFPALVIFGGMGWAGQLCDIGAMMTASVALGIAVDDTIHFLSWFRRGVQQGFGRSEAVHLAYRRCGKAMLQTTVICGLGMLVFGLSSFIPTARFASLMFMLLVVALVGDLVLLPALLTGPLGRYFTQTQIQSVRGKRPVCSAEPATLATAQWEHQSVQDRDEKPAFADRAR